MQQIEMGNPVIGSTFQEVLQDGEVYSDVQEPAHVWYLTCADTVTCRLRTALAEDMGAGIRRR